MLQQFKRVAARPHRIFSNFFFDPWFMVKKWRGLGPFVRNAIRYARQNDSSKFRLTVSNFYYRSYDRYSGAGSIPVHYFMQDLWVARFAFQQRVGDVVDVGSRFDGFVSHLLTFADVTYLDIRPISVRLPNLRLVAGDIMSLPFANDSIGCLTCLHVIEHIGLGRYGDPVDPSGYAKAALELERVVKPGGLLVVSTVIGMEKLCFDAHRIFDPSTVTEMFARLVQESFCLIDDVGDRVIEGASINAARKCNYG